jgi:hypothetical protein
MTIKEKPSLISITRSDRWGNLALRIPFIFIVVLGIMFFMESLSKDNFSYFTTEPGSVPSLVYFTAGAVIISIPVLLWRYRYYMEVFQKGTAVEGVVTSIYRRGRNGYIEFSFRHNNREIKYYNSFFRNKEAGLMKEGDRVTILMLDNDPEKTHIKELLL